MDPDDRGLDFHSYLKDLQIRICQALSQEEDGSRPGFRQDGWSSDLGTGNSCILEAGSLFERAAVNVSLVGGEHLPSSATERRSDLVGAAYRAMGLSVVVHPRNPYVPTSHANIRYFEAQPADLSLKPVWWFGGGLDLTPCYPFEEDCIHWHTTAYKACETFGTGLYAKYKKACDEYFFIKHRQESRGIGGLFFDDLNEVSMGWNFEKTKNFIKSIADSYIDAYLPIVQRRKNRGYSDRERFFQLYRRGRYVEFNLLYDRGTLFGIHSGGRAESILVSLPSEVRWCYDWQPEPGSPEALAMAYFKNAREWIPA